MKNRKKLEVFLIGIILVLQMISCGNPESSTNNKIQNENLISDETEQNSVKNQGSISKQETSNEDQQQAKITDTESTNGNRILIAYFSAGENSDVDVVSSASVTTVDGKAKGRLRAVADMIQAETNGTLFSIQTSVKYPGDGGALINYAAEEQDKAARPTLTNHIENLNDYDIIFVGYPNWWYDMPMAMYSFFDEYDFSGKTIIPFNVHNGSRFSGTISTIQQLEPNATVVTDGFTVSEREVARAADDVASWVRKLGYK